MKTVQSYGVLGVVSVFSSSRPSSKQILAIQHPLKSPKKFLKIHQRSKHQTSYQNSLRKLKTRLTQASKRATEMNELNKINSE